MKKILVSMFAVAALAACTSEQTIVAPQNEAIGFDTFVDNSTRATDITTANIANFGVYGTVTKGGNSALIFKNTEVTKSNDAFVYSPAQYWIAAAEYDFLAFAPYAERQWTYTPTNAQVAKTGTFSFNNETAAADQDVVYAYQTKTTADKLDASNTQAVEFTFKHILSKVAFSFT
ncbi:MAG: fimbrillin family protein, partial [Alistipes sp.]|nr:fimbrillin family protein [Alistipes sp.]